MIDSIQAWTADVLLRLQQESRNLALPAPDGVKTEDKELIDQ